MLTLLCSFGHVASYAELLERFHGQESAVLPFRDRDGRVIRRLRQNVYACAHLDEEEVAAARVGGLLDCVTVLRRAGALSDGDDDGCLHLRLRKNDGRASARRWEETRAVRAHWTELREPAPSVDASRWAARFGGEPLSRLEVPLLEGLRQALRSCLSAAQAAHVFGALLDGGLAPEQLAGVVSSVPAAAQRRLMRAELPPKVCGALRGLRSGNIFDEW